MSCNFFNVLQFSFVLVLYVNTFTSFSNFMKIVFFSNCSHIFNKFALKNKYNIDKTKNFCEISTFTLFISFFFLLKVIDNFRFLKSFLFMKFFNLKFFFSLNCEKIECTKHDHKYLSYLHLLL